MMTPSQPQWLQMATSLLVIGSIGTGVWFGFESSHGQRIQAARSQLEVHASELAQRLNLRLAQEIRELQGMAKTKAISGPKKDAGEALSVYTGINDFFDRVMIIDAQGRLVASSLYDQSEFEDFSNEGWFRQVLREGSITKTDAVGAGVKNATLSLAVPVASVRTNGPGTVVAQISIKKLESLLQSESRRNEKIQILTEPVSTKDGTSTYSTELFGALARRTTGAHQDSSGFWGYSPAGAVTNLEWMVLVSTTPISSALPAWNWAVVAGTCGGMALFFILSFSSLSSAYHRRFEVILEELHSMEETAHRGRELSQRHIENITECTKRVQQVGAPFQALQNSYQTIAPAFSVIDKAHSGLQMSAEQARVVLEGIAATIEEIPLADALTSAPVAGVSAPDLRQFQAWVEQIKAKTRAFHELAFQTKLLSFNAAVEADRVGESGKGVLIIAEELANLAVTSGQSARELAKSLDEAPTKVDDFFPKVAAPQAHEQSAPGATRLVQLLDAQRSSIKRLHDAIRAMIESSAIIGEATHDLQSRKDNQTQLLAHLHSIIEDLDQRSRQTLSEFARAPSGAESIEESIQLIRTAAQDPERATGAAMSPANEASSGHQPPEAPPFRSRRKRPVREQALHEALPHARRSAPPSTTRRTG